MMKEDSGLLEKVNSEKTCSKCSITKPITDFVKNNVLKTGYAPHCKQCHKKYMELSRGTFGVVVQPIKCSNCSTTKIFKKKLYLKAIEHGWRCEACSSKHRYKLLSEEERESLLTKQREFARKKRQNNPELVRSQYNATQKRLYHSHPNYRLGRLLRSRINTAMKRLRCEKVGSAVNDLGCSIPELRQYIESLFQPGMSWENYGARGWHIDHRKPLSSFNLTCREEFLKACHYTNLQPLWWQENLCKGDRVLV